VTFKAQGFKSREKEGIIYNGKATGNHVGEVGASQL